MDTSPTVVKFPALAVLLMVRVLPLLAIRLPFLAKVSFQILLPAANDEGEHRVELTLYFLRLAPWIVRPASPSARAGTMTGPSWASRQRIC